MAPRFVAPYRQGDKNDGINAEAICETVSHPGTRFAVKSVIKGSESLIPRAKSFENSAKTCEP